MMTEPLHRDKWIVRRWKRDGTTNRMLLSDAVENLHSHGVEAMTRRDIIDLLLKGTVLQTAHASFGVEGVV